MTLVVAVLPQVGSAQVRVPVATEPINTTTTGITLGPAPYNAKVTVTQLNAATVSWDVMPGTKFTQNQRTDMACTFTSMWNLDAKSAKAVPVSVQY